MKKTQVIFFFFCLLSLGQGLTVSTYHHWFNQRLQSQCHLASSLRWPMQCPALQDPARMKGLRDSQVPVRTSRAASAHAGPGWAPATWEERDQGTAQQRASEQGPEVPTSKPHANASRQAWPSLRCSFAADSVRSQAKPRRARRCEARGTLRPSIGLVENVISHPGPQPSIHAHPGLGPL